MEPRPLSLLDYREYPVLYVDDEPENLRIFELGFRRDFSILTATSAEEGLRILNEKPVVVVLSDHRMPGMTGVEFLTQVRELDPKTIRVLVTAYGDAETLGVAINDGSIYRYVPKPWEPEELRVTLKRAIEVYALDREREGLVRELTAVNQIAQTINQELDLDPLLDQLLSAITEDLGFDAAAILFLSDGRENLHIDRVVPNGDEVGERITSEPIRVSAAPAFAGRLLDGEAQILSVAKVMDYEAPIRRWVTEVAADEILVVPLIGKKGVIGAIAVDNRRGGSGFGVAERTLLEGLATQAAIAIDNARLVEDLRRSRQQVLRADRLGTLGTLAAGLAHEINNPMVSIHTFLSLAGVKRNEDDEEFWGDYYRLACQEVDRIRGLVATMGRLGRSGTEQTARSSCDLLSLANEVATLLAPEATAAAVRLEVSGATETPKVIAVRDQIHQVLLNLFLNAIHATPTGGKIRIRVSPGGPGGRTGASIEVTDPGPGIGEEDLDRIFDPFFTTKGPDQGSGLGLMICHRIVADHQGIIEVSSRVGEGATFRVLLPQAPDPAVSA
jgi:signal transduction histidine kinase/CheY-like chemotaxis protein